jgi:hypothetical protein
LAKEGFMKEMRNELVIEWKSTFEIMELVMESIVNLSHPFAEKLCELIYAKGRTFASLCMLSSQHSPWRRVTISNICWVSQSMRLDY